jgi:hypothetical protein
MKLRKLSSLPKKTTRKKLSMIDIVRRLDRLSDDEQEHETPCSTTLFNN